MRRRRPSPRSFRQPKTELRFLFTLADRLHKFVSEVEEMPRRERIYWRLLMETEDAERQLAQASD